MKNSAMVNKVQNYFRARNKHTGEIKEAWCRSHNFFHFLTQRHLWPCDWVCEQEIIWDRDLLKKMLDK